MKNMIKKMMIATALMMPVAEAMAAELLMFEHRGCIACKKFKAETLPEYTRSALGQKLKIRSIVEGSSSDVADIDLKGSPFYYSPTFVLVDDNKELARIRGYGGKAAFWQEVRKLERKFKKQIEG